MTKEQDIFPLTTFLCFVYTIVYMKTITLSDEIYEKLVKIKGEMSFNAIIEELIKKNVEKRIEQLVEVLEETGYEEELEEI